MRPVAKGWSSVAARVRGPSPVGGVHTSDGGRVAAGGRAGGAAAGLGVCGRAGAGSACGRVWAVGDAAGRPRA